MKTYLNGSVTNGKPIFGSRWRKYILLLPLLLTLMGFESVAQEKVSGQNEKTIAVIDLFKKIQDKTGYRFFYSDDLVDLNKGIVLENKAADIELVIAELKQKTKLDFRILENKLIVVMPAGSVQQAMLVQGKVTASSDGLGIPGVNVFIKGTTNGTITDFDGEYSLEVPDQYAVLSFSFIGFEPHDEPLNGQSRLNIVLNEDMRNLKEVVITALNIERDKSSLGYSVTQLGGEEMNQAKENNVINGMAGKVAGLQVTKAPTGVDGSTRVVLRGINSLTGNNRPLIVVDGIPVDASSGGAGQWGGKDMGDALSDLNPEDIESYSVLKGAGAAAAYGSRGANGVILITTKKGKKGKGLGISTSSSYQIEQPYVFPDFQNEYGHGAFGQYPTKVNAMDISDTPLPWGWSWGPKMDGLDRLDFIGNMSPYEPQPDNYKDFFQNGSSLVNNVTFENGSENGSFRASITTQNSSGILKNNDLNRQTFNLRGFSKFGSVLEVDGKVTYIHQKVFDRPYLSESSANVGAMLSMMPRNIRLDDLKAHQTDEDGNEHLWTNDVYTTNPYWQREHVRNQDEKHRLQTVLSTRAIISSHLDVTLRSGFDFTNKIAQDRTDPGSKFAGINGYLANSFSNSIEWNSDFLINYKNKIASELSTTFSLGGNYRYNQWKGMNQSGSSYKVPEFYAISNMGTYGTGEWFGEKEVYSLYVLGQFGFKDWLYLDLTLRNDWSSTLPLDNNSYSYHSENLSFLFTKAFGLESWWLNSGKIRGSYAKVGNDTGAYQTELYYTVNQSQLPYGMGSIGSQLPFYDLQPEDTRSWETGLNLSLFNQRVDLDMTYYYSLSDNQIMSIPLATSSGYGSKKANAGKIENKGLEFQLGMTPIKVTNFTWNLSFNYSANQSKVKEIYQSVESIVLGEQFHASIEARPGEPYGQIYTSDFKRDKFGNKLVDDKGYVLKGERKAMGNINPDWLGGVSNRFQYKDLSLSFLIDMQKGGEIYSWGKAYKSLFGTAAETLEGRDGWYATHDPATDYSTPLPGVTPQGYVEDGINEKTGKVNTTPVDPMFRWYNIWSKEIGAEWIQDATNVRLREVVLTWQLPTNLLMRTPIKKVSLALTGRNLFFLYRAMDHVDPESGYSSGNVGSGIEHSAMPSTRSYGFNVKINF